MKINLELSNDPTRRFLRLKGANYTVSWICVRSPASRYFVFVSWDSLFWREREQRWMASFRHLLQGWPFCISRQRTHRNGHIE